MTVDALTCYRCQGRTTPGMLVQHDSSAPNRLRWVSGAPRAGMAAAFLGEGSGDREHYRVTTYRCTQCGALESFAVETE